MKHVVSISLGSSKRDHVVTINIMGEECRVERLGTDGNMQKMIEKIRELDGKVDAFGLGGWICTFMPWIDVTICAMRVESLKPP